MAAADLRAQADRAFVDEEYDSALSLYTKAISAAPNDAGLHDARAQCHLKLRDYTEAVQDASRAVELDPSHAKAHLRLGQAFFHLEEYEAARDTLEKGQRLDAGNAQFATWIRKCNAELAEEGAAAAPSTAAPAAAVRPTADASRPTTDQPHKPAEPAASAKPAAPAPAPSPATSAPAAAGASSAPLAPAAPVEFEGKYRHQWYQLQDKVSVDIYAKGLSKEQVRSLGDRKAGSLWRFRGRGTSAPVDLLTARARRAATPSEEAGCLFNFWTCHSLLPACPA